MTITQIRAFATVCEEASVTKAAERLCIAQPAVSRLLKDLSRQCSFQLFENTGGKLKPTEKAMGLLDDINDILLRIDALEKKMTGTENDFVMKIGFNLSSEIGIMLSATREMERRYPGIKISISEDKSSVFEHKLIKGELDFALLIDTVHNPQLSRRALCDKEFCWVCRKDHRLAAEKAVSANMLMEEKLALPYFHGDDPIELNFGLMQKAPDRETTWFTTNAFTALDAVLTGGYISLLPMRVVRPHMASGELVPIATEAPCTPQVSAVYFKGKKLSPAMNEFIDVFTKLFQETA